MGELVQKNQNHMSSKELLKAIYPFWKPYRKRLFSGLILLVFAASFSMVQPWILKLAIDDLESGQFKEKVWSYAGIILLIVALVCICRFGMRLLIIGVSRRFEHDLRSHVFKHMQILNRSFFDKVQTGDIMSRLTNDIQQIRMILGPALMQIGNTFVSLAFALFVMFRIDAKLTLLALAPLPVMPIMFYFMGKKIRYHSRRVQEQMASITSCAQENIVGIRVIKAYNLEEIESKKFSKFSDGYVSRNLDLIRFQGLFIPLVVLLSGISTAFILFFCGWWVVSGRISLGSMVAFIEYLGILSWPMFAIGWVVGLIQQGSAAMVRVNKILAQPACTGMLPVKTDISVSDLYGDIVFDNVSFKYTDDGGFVINRLSFTVYAGETLAIMGASGSGKSTILELLTRSYVPDSGKITFNGHDISMLPEYLIRKSIGVMPQIPVLFSRSILNNLEFGNRKTSKIGLNDALQTACITPDIEAFPDKLATKLGERGVNISGGQKQRLTLARAILRDPIYLILDDPFSSVDISTEEDILKYLPNISKTRTTIIVSHRINTAKRADRILIINDGTVDEIGSHNELVQKNGYYADLCRKQKLIEELEII